MSPNGKYSEQHNATYSEKVFREKLLDFSKFLSRQIPLFATVTASIWGVAEVITSVNGERLSLNTLSTPSLAVALAIALYRAYKEYKNYVPEALSSENQSAINVYRRGESGWNFALAKEMLMKRISELDRTLDRVAIGSEYIPPKNVSATEYLEWIKARPETLRRLSHATATQCTKELPEVIGKTQNEQDLIPLKGSIEQLAKLYKELVNFEIEGRSINPPAKLIELHEMTWGWTEPIREGTSNFIELMEVLSKLNVKRILSGEDKIPNLMIEFPEPKNMNKFSEKLGSLDSTSFHD